MLSACSKQENLINLDEQPQTTVQQIMSTAMDRYSEMPDEQRASSVRQMYQSIGLLSSSSYKSKAFSTDVPLEDIFYVYEGAINASMADWLHSSDHVYEQQATFDVPVFQNASGDYLVSASDFVNFHNDLIDEIESSLDTTINENLMLTNLTLNSIQGGLANITMAMLINNPGSWIFRID